MESDEPKFVQAAPAAAAGGKLEAVEQKLEEKRARSGWGPQLKEDQLDEEADSFLNWLVRYPVERNHPRPTTGSIPVQKSGDAVVCISTDKVSDVLDKLIVEGFLSMPVLSAHDNRFIGFIDMLDLVWYTLWSFGTWRESQAGAGGVSVAESRESFGSYLALERFRNAVVQDVIGRPGFGTRNQATQVYKGFSLFHVFETMARISTHRVAITNSERKVTGFISQSMIISLLDQHLDRIGVMANIHTVSEIVPGLWDELKIVQQTELALTAFKRMVQHNISGLAVVNEKGELVDNISVRDLRGCGGKAENWTNLWMSVREFKAHCAAKFRQQTPSKPIYVEKHNTLRDVIRKMDDGNLHRVFVVEMKDGAPIPTHCISQRDVLRFLIYLCGLKNTALEDLERAAEIS